MARRHLAFRRFHPTTVSATDQFFESKPWSGDDEEKQTKFEKWLRRVSDAYGIPAPTLEVQLPDIRDDRSGYYNLGQITLYKFSVITLFHEFRHHMQALGAVEVEATGDDTGDIMATEIDAVSWACSLFYKSRPVKFRKLVREGKIRFVHPNDLLTSESLAQQQQQLTEPPISTTEVMQRLERSRSWVCAHAVELGGVQDLQGRWAFPASTGLQPAENQEQ